VARLEKSVTNGQCDARLKAAFPDTAHHRPLTGTKSYSWWQGHDGVINLPSRYAAAPQPGVEPTTCWSQVQCWTRSATTPPKLYRTSSNTPACLRNYSQSTCTNLRDINYLIRLQYEWGPCSYNHSGTEHAVLCHHAGLRQCITFLNRLMLTAKRNRITALRQLYCIFH